MVCEFEHLQMNGSIKTLALSEILRELGTDRSFPKGVFGKWSWAPTLISAPFRRK